MVLVPADSTSVLVRLDGEAVIGFDPNDAALDNVYDVEDGNVYFLKITPMTCFAHKGDAKMCRYLISRGASTTKSFNEDFPMYVAAGQGHLDICKLLFEHGAKNDIRRDGVNGWTPFVVAARNRRDEVLRWLVLQGALCADGGSDELEGSVIYPMNYRTPKPQHFVFNYGEVRQNISISCERLVDWAKEVTQTHSAVVMFLLGALPPAPDTEQSRNVQCLSGYPGVRKHIGEFVGLEVTKQEHLRILRNVAELLPSFIQTADEE
jgi:hypothetical protein